MHREDLLRSLAAYEATETDAAQKTVAQAIADFVRRRPDCFFRSCTEGHITGSAWVLDASGDKALLMLHKKLGRWLQPGGHADGESEVAEVALREAEEESGLSGLSRLSPRIFDVDIHAIPARPGEPEHLHYDLRFALKAPEGAELVGNEESLALGWFAREAILEMRVDASVRRLAHKWRPRPDPA